VAPVTAWASPERAGTDVTRKGATLPIFAALADAAAAGAVVAPGAPSDAVVVMIPASPRFDATTLPLPTGRELVVWAADDGACPIIVSTNPVLPALELRGIGGAAGEPDPIRPTRWLGGLWIDGRLEIVANGGVVDVRWCTLGRPGSVGVRVPGAGWETASVRRSVPPPELTVRLYGCRVGRVELPPWVRLVAAGCTFDAGDDGATAVDAAGATVELRHCTLRGAIAVGSLAATSSVFTGETRCDRPDLGWIRSSAVAPGGAAPRLWRCYEGVAPLASFDPADPRYLTLDVDAAPFLLAAGEDHVTPGAAPELAARHRELRERTVDFLPMTMEARHDDRARRSLLKMTRRRS
jgi:hypothetical protein